MITNYVFFAVLYYFCIRFDVHKRFFQMDLTNLSLFIRGLVGGLLLIVLYALVFIVSGYGTLAIEPSSFKDQVIIFLNLCITFLGVALFEELLFRGIAYELIQRWIRNKMICALIVAVVFSSIHYSHYIVLETPLAAFMTAFSLSLLMSAMYIKDQSLVRAVGLHAIWNTLVIGLRFLESPTSGWHRFSIQVITNGHEPLWVLLSDSAFILIYALILISGLLLKNRQNNCPLKEQSTQ